MKTCKEYRSAAWNSLSGNWTPAVLAALVYFLIVAAVSSSSYVPLIFPSVSSMISCVSSIGSILLVFPLTVGVYYAVRRFYLDGDDNIMSNMFSGAFDGYLRNVGTMLLYGILIVLGCFLLLIPGFILSLAYAFVPFLIKDCPETGISYILTKSRTMMKGRKWQLFKLQLSFLGWILLGIVTCGIGLLWVMPYYWAAIVAFYEDAKADVGD